MINYGVIQGRWGRFSSPQTRLILLNRNFEHASVFSGDPFALYSDVGAENVPDTVVGRGLLCCHDFASQLSP